MLGRIANLDHRRTLTYVSAVVGLPVALSLGFGEWRWVEHVPWPWFPDPLRGVLALVGLEAWTISVGMCIGLALLLADWALEKYRGWYQDELYAILKELGEGIQGGASVEAAAQKAVGYRRSPPAWVFQEALRMSADVPFDQALRHVARSSGQAAMAEVGELVAAALASGGDFGPALRWLAAHFQRLRLSEKEFGGTIAASLLILRVMALIAGPVMYSALVGRFASFMEEAPMISIFPVVFFFTSVLGMAALDGLVYGRWDRVLPKLPLFLGATRLSLGL